mgnify:FL=1
MFHRVHNRFYIIVTGTENGEMAMGTDGPLTSSGPEPPDDSILNAFKPVLVLVGALLLFFAALVLLS